jgi:hypothetical protein
MEGERMTPEERKAYIALLRQQADKIARELSAELGDRYKVVFDIRPIDRAPGEAPTPVHDGRHGTTCLVCFPVTA